jgi:hypothetical protein
VLIIREKSSVAEKKSLELPIPLHTENNIPDIDRSYVILGRCKQAHLRIE